MAREMDLRLPAFPARPQLRRLGRRWKQKCTCLHQPLYWEGNFNTFLSPKLYFMYNINERTLNLTPTTSNDGFDPSPIESQCGLLLERPRWVKIYSPTCFFFFFHFLWRSLLKNPFLSSKRIDIEQSLFKQFKEFKQHKMRAILHKMLYSVTISLTVSLCFYQHASFGFTVDGRINTSFTRKCCACSSPYCREVTV